MPAKKTKIEIIRTLAALILPLLVLLSSCVGVSVDITLNGDGAGTLNLEYRISASLDSLGELDGNERWNTVPVGEADFRRTLARLPGMKLLSFSQKDEGADIVSAAKMGFENMDALLAFLDAAHERSVFSGSPESGSVVFTLSEGGAGESPESFSKLLEEISASYSVKMSMTFPAEGTLLLTDSGGRPLGEIPGSEKITGGKKVSFSLPLYELLSSRDGIKAEFRW